MSSLLNSLSKKFETSRVNGVSQVSTAAPARDLSSSQLLFVRDEEPTLILSHRVSSQAGVELGYDDDDENYDEDNSDATSDSSVNSEDEGLESLCKSIGELLNDDSTSQLNVQPALKVNGVPKPVSLIASSVSRSSAFNHQQHLTPSKAASSAAPSSVSRSPNPSVGSPLRSAARTAQPSTQGSSSRLPMSPNEHPHTLSPSSQGYYDEAATVAFNRDDQRSPFHQSNEHQNNNNHNQSLYATFKSEFDQSDKKAIEALLQERRGLLDEIAELEDQLIAAQRRDAQLTAQLSTFHSELADVKTAFLQEQSEMTAEMDALREELVAVQQARDELGELQEASREARLSLQDEIAELSKQAVEKDQELTRLKEEIAVKEEEVESLKLAIEALRGENNKLTEENSALTEKVKQMESKSSSAQQDVVVLLEKALKEEQARTTTAETLRLEAEREVERLKAELHRSREAHMAAERALIKSTMKNAGNTKDQTSVQGNQDVAALKAEVAACKEELSVSNSHASQLTAQVSDLQSQVDELEGELLNRQKRLDQAIKEKRQVANSLGALETAHAEVKARANALQVRLDDVTAQKDKARFAVGELSKLSAKIDSLNAKLEKVEKERDRFQTLYQDVLAGGVGSPAACRAHASAFGSEAVMVVPNRRVLPQVEEDVTGQRSLFDEMVASVSPKVHSVKASVLSPSPLQSADVSPQFNFNNNINNANIMQQRSQSPAANANRQHHRHQQQRSPSPSASRASSTPTVRSSAIPSQIPHAKPSSRRASIMQASSLMQSAHAHAAVHDEVELRNDSNMITDSTPVSARPLSTSRLIQRQLLAGQPATAVPALPLDAIAASARGADMSASLSSRPRSTGRSQSVERTRPRPRYDEQGGVLLTPAAPPKSSRRDLSASAVAAPVTPSARNAPPPGTARSLKSNNMDLLSALHEISALPMTPMVRLATPPASSRRNIVDTDRAQSNLLHDQNCQHDDHSAPNNNHNSHAHYFPQRQADSQSAALPSASSSHAEDTPFTPPKEAAAPVPAQSGLVRPSPAANANVQRGVSTSNNDPMLTAFQRKRAERSTSVQNFLKRVGSEMNLHDDKEASPSIPLRRAPSGNFQRPTPMDNAALVAQQRATDIGRARRSVRR